MRFSKKKSAGHVAVKATTGVSRAGRTHVGEQSEAVHKEQQPVQLAAESQWSLEVRAAERTRIARELHDTLLQRFNGLLLRLQAIFELIPRRPDEARELLHHAIEKSAKALAETREAVQGLRAAVEEPNGLVAAIGSLGAELAADLATIHSASLRFIVEGSEWPLDPVVRDGVYRIASEALRNALQHSQCTKIEVEFRYNRQRFRLRVRDDGKGISARALAAAQRKEHFGLCVMRERAGLIGAKISVWSGLDAGTEIELTIAASRAYIKPARARSHRRNP